MQVIDQKHIPTCDVFFFCLSHSEFTGSVYSGRVSTGFWQFSCVSSQQLLSGQSAPSLACTLCFPSVFSHLAEKHNYICVEVGEAQRNAQ